MYIPPFNITEKILHQIAEISEQVGSLNSRIENDLPSPMLRKKNQNMPQGRLTDIRCGKSRWCKNSESIFCFSESNFKYSKSNAI